VSAQATAVPRKSLVPMALVVVLIAVLPFFGPGGVLAAAVLGMALLGMPLFVIIGVTTILCFILWAGFGEMREFSVLMERIRTLADSPTLLAIPLFMMSGCIMSRGQISERLVGFAKSVVGWFPGGLAISTVIACMLFAAISGSSPATVVAIGATMGPTLIAHRYSERFSHGLVTSAGSLGILIPPSIPMIVYPIVYQKSFIEVEALFASGFGPGLVMGAILIGVSIYRGFVDRTPRQAFSLREVGISIRDGFWALMFPVLILGGIYGGIFNAIEAAAVSVVYAVVVEVWVHRAMGLRDLPKAFRETGVFLGSLLVIMVAALALSEFLESQGIAAAAVRAIRTADLEPWQFLIVINVLLLAVGCLMDILSAMFIFVPLLAPIAVAMGVDPMHFGIIFIVNLEIGYLTPPIGLNLFVASTMFDKPMGHIVRSVLPFIGLMIVGLGLITYVPALSVGLGNWIMGRDATQSPAPVILTDINVEGDDSGDDGALELEEIAAELERLRAIDMQGVEQATREMELQALLDEELGEIRAELDQLRAIDMQSVEQATREMELQSLLDRYGGDDAGQALDDEAP